MTGEWLLPALTAAFLGAEAIALMREGRATCVPVALLAGFTLALALLSLTGQLITGGH